MAVIEGTYKSGSAGYSGRPQLVRGQYSFATDGGAVSTITLRMEGGRTIPSGAMLTRAWVQVGTSPTSGGSATIAVGVESNTTLLGATAISSSPWSTTGSKFFTVSAPVLTTAARSITVTVATAALTAGVFDVYVEYVDPAA